MTIDVYQVSPSADDLARRTAVFTDLNGADIDPTTVAYKAVKPDGTVLGPYTFGQDAEVVKDSTGHYHVDVAIDQRGDWYETWISTGTGQAVEPGQFIVEGVA